MPQNVPPDWMRDDGTLKGLGFLGPLRLPNGGVASEYSVADGEDLKDAHGGYLDYPSIVPTLTRDEVQAVMRSASDPTRQTPIPDGVMHKAMAFALQRKQQGLPLFARPGEEQNLYPDMERTPAPDFVTQNYNAMQRLPSQQYGQVEPVVEPMASHQQDLMSAAMRRELMARMLHR